MNCQVEFGFLLIIDTFSLEFIASSLWFSRSKVAFLDVTLAKVTLSSANSPRNSRFFSFSSLILTTTRQNGQNGWIVNFPPWITYPLWKNCRTKSPFLLMSFASLNNHESHSHFERSCRYVFQIYNDSFPIWKDQSRYARDFQESSLLFSGKRKVDKGTDPWNYAPL